MTCPQVESDDFMGSAYLLVEAEYGECSKDQL